MEYSIARSGTELVRPAEKEQGEAVMQEKQQPSSASKCDKEVTPDERRGE